MRITDDLLHKLAIDAVKTRSRTEPDIHAAYLTGSILTDDPLLGGATDVDIVLVHRYTLTTEREVEAIRRRSLWISGMCSKIPMNPTENYARTPGWVTP